jgi:hypothetical protein
MNHRSAVATEQPVSAERWTLIAVSCLAYILAVALHEHGGHSAACVLLGGRPLEMGAFYVSCDQTRLSPLDIRLVAVAGPAVSLILGVGCFAVLGKLRGAATTYFLWLLGTVGLMEVSGYLLFSGVTGLGDLGTGPDGVLFGASPQLLWRGILTLSGAFTYVWVVHFSLERFEPFFFGTGPERLTLPRRAALTSYCMGAATYLLVGAFNPHGWQILLTSVLPAGLGGTSGLLWMFQLADPEGRAYGPGFTFERHWRWIAAGLIVTLAYGLIFARTYHWSPG